MDTQTASTMMGRRAQTSNVVLLLVLACGAHTANAQPAPSASSAIPDASSTQVWIRSLCPKAEDKRCKVPHFDASGVLLGQLDLANNAPNDLSAVNKGGLLEVQLQSGRVLLSRLDVLLRRQGAAPPLAVPCTVVAGVLSAGCR